MTSSKRRREMARAKAERQAARRQKEAESRRRRNVIIAVVAVVIVLAGGVAWVALNRSGDATPTDAATASPTPEPTDVQPSDSPSPSPQSESPTPTDSGSPSPEPDSTCDPAPAPRADDMSWDSAPADTLKPNTDYTLDLTTNCGAISIAMEAEKAPATVNSMAFLADQGYFDLTACHRLTTAGIFVLQCGDPKGDGTGGPGYSVPDENLPAAGEGNYPAGTVAMANAGPGTAGSQFFIVYDTTTLGPDYTIWGKVTQGLDVVKGIAAAGVEGGGADGPPAQPVTIETAKVTSKKAG